MLYYIITFFSSVVAGVVSNYICRWLDRNIADDDSGRHEETPENSHFSGVSPFCD